MADSPAVVLVHGLASSSDHGWRPSGWIDLLQEAHREVIPIDLPGHGSARRSADPADYPDVATEIAQVFADRGPVDAVGFSAGAQLLLECAVRGLASFHRLALLGVGPSMFGPRADVESYLPADPSTVDPGNITARLFRNLAARAGNDLASVSAFARRPTRGLTEADLTAVSCEVLVVTGERDPVGSPEELAAHLPHATGRTIARADHFSLQANMQAMTAVFDFLKV